MTLEAGWYPVALSDSLPPGTSAGTKLFGMELVLWRDTHGNVHGWEDRCPHRGMRLSFGFVRGDRLACLYHGWQYDGSGRCRLIPAHPRLDVPETIRVSPYATTEAIGIIWVFSDPAANAPDPPAQAEDSMPLRSLYIDRPAEVVRGFLLSRGAQGISPRLLRLDGAGVALVGGVQPVAADRSALHLVHAGAAGDRVATALWAEALRHAIETAEMHA